jgi:hypothetical protein
MKTSYVGGVVHRESGTGLILTYLGHPQFLKKIKLLALNFTRIRRARRTEYPTDTKVAITCRDVYIHSLRFRQGDGWCAVTTTKPRTRKCSSEIAHSHHPRLHSHGARMVSYLRPTIISRNTSSHGHYIHDDGIEKCMVNEILDKKERNAA